MRKVVFAMLGIGLIGLTLSFTEEKNDKYFEISKNIEIFTNVYKELNTWYVDDLDPFRISLPHVVSLRGVHIKTEGGLFVFGYLLA